RRLARGLARPRQGPSPPHPRPAAPPAHVSLPTRPRARRAPVHIPRVPPVRDWRAPAPPCRRWRFVRACRATPPAARRWTARGGGGASRTGHFLCCPYVAQGTNQVAELQAVGLAADLAARGARAAAAAGAAAG